MTVYEYLAKSAADLTPAPKPVAPAPKPAAPARKMMSPELQRHLAPADVLDARRMAVIEKEPNPQRAGELTRRFWPNEPARIPAGRPASIEDSGFGQDYADYRRLWGEWNKQRAQYPQTPDFPHAEAASNPAAYYKKVPPATWKDWANRPLPVRSVSPVKSPPPTIGKQNMPWSLEQFMEHYEKSPPRPYGPQIGRDANKQMQLQQWQAYRDATVPKT